MNKHQRNVQNGQDFGEVIALIGVVFVILLVLVA